MKRIRKKLVEQQLNDDSLDYNSERFHYRLSVYRLSDNRCLQFVLPLFMSPSSVNLIIH
jgi:hypothetical protein